MIPTFLIINFSELTEEEDTVGFFWLEGVSYPIHNLAPPRVEVILKMQSFVTPLLCFLPPVATVIAVLLVFGKCEVQSFRRVAYRSWIDIRTSSPDL